MFGLTGAARIYLYRGIIRSEVGADPLSGSLFVFVNRRRSMAKLLYWDRDGLAIWYKRLERGCFILPDRFPADGLIERRDLTMLLEGIVPKKVGRRYKL